MAAPPLTDSFGRVHDNLRVSVTDRCNIRCFYCMPESGVQFVRRAEILDFEEIERFVRIAAGLGIAKVRWRSPPTACCSANWPPRCMMPACGA
jgi:molybdenum cofactor biosynthesis enzyme MoaA